MLDKEKYEKAFSEPPKAESAPRRRRRRGPSKKTRAIVSILVILLVMYLLYLIGAGLVSLFTSDKGEKEAVLDPVTTLQIRLDELTIENKTLSDENKELKAIIDEYSKKYGALSPASALDDTTTFSE